MRELPKIYDFKNKEFNVRNYIRNMENKLQTIFTWSGLPETIESRWLEKILQRNGSITVLEIKDSEIKQYADSRSIPGGIYALRGDIGGVEDFNGNGVFSIVAHPRLYSSLQKKIDEDCVVIYNDSNKHGLWDLHLLYASLLAENDLSIKIADIATRAMTIATVTTDTEKLAFEDYISKLEAGSMSALVGNMVLDSVKMQNYAGQAHQMITDLIELEQYLKASWSREFGMNSQFNMKREAINDGESQLGEDEIMTLLQDMLNERKKGAEKINAMFGLNITVEFSNIFKNNLVDEETEEVEDEQVETDQSEAEITVSKETGTNPDGDPDDIGESESVEDGEREETVEEEAVEEEKERDIVIETVEGDVIIVDDVPDISEVKKTEEVEDEVEEQNNE